MLISTYIKINLISLKMAKRKEFSKQKVPMSSICRKIIALKGQVQSLRLSRLDEIFSINIFWGF